MRIWGNNNNAGPTSAEQRGGSSSNNKVLNSSGLPMDSVMAIPPCDDDMTTDDDDDKYAAQLKQLKQDLMMEGRQDDAPQPQSSKGSSAEQPQQRVGGEEKKKSNKKSKKDKSGSGRKAGAAEKEEKRGHTLNRMMASAVEKEATSSGHHDQVKVIYRQFGPDANQVLTVEHDAGGIPSPESPDHVVVKVQASTVSLEDCLMRRGFDFDVLHPLCLPQTPGFDIVGNVCACGSQAERIFEEGDRVAALVRTGGNARFLSVPASSLVKLPRQLDCAEAAAMVSIYTTAYQTLKRITQKSPMFSLLGSKVLIIGGMDAVGQALIQMCCKARAEIYATGPERKHSYIRNILGVHPLPENKEDWLPKVKGEMDFVFDGICEDGLESSSEALKDGGEIVCYGHTAMLREREMGILGAPLSAHLNKLWSHTKPNAKEIDIWQSFREDPETYKKNLKSLFQLLKWNKVKPHIAKRVALTEVAAAQTKLENGEIRGTIVCLPWKKIGVDE